ncbi:hypothetical protein [Thalassotalea sp. PLHSN55]|uniref:hypothetical protein n=1 Tax=Thalassotalea sp. PLHSN55 TaxID=3435888 RepID=UPI003F82BBAD
MKKRLIGTFTALAFVGSFILANYLSGNSITLQVSLNRATHWLESLFYTSQEPNQSPAHTEQVTTHQNLKKQYSHVEVGYAKTCKDTSLGKIKYKKVGQVYTWVDDKGIANFSSTPPKNDDFTLLNYAGEKVFDYFTLNLNLNAENVPYDFHQKLTLKLNKLFEVYGQLVDSSSLKKVDIKLNIFTSKHAFNQIKAKHNMSDSDNTLGFYSHATNQAFLLLTNHATTMRTATHEAAHAINRAIIGYSPRWLNEGLAEYSEYIEVKGQISKVYPNQNWTNNGLLSEQVLPLEQLLTATNHDWNSKLKNKLYATSWAFIYFMMDNPQRKNMLAKVIQLEQQNLCDINDIWQVKTVLDLPRKELQRQFTRWARRDLQKQLI